ncbi:hypothetical protein FRC00_008475 [Tulasnella sp. 408]|nr:hypothetical protein FRC00_008475 [Tulasnella sp. 408]
MLFYDPAIAPLEQDIVAACQQHEILNEKKPKFRRSIPYQDKYFVKWGAMALLRPEADTQDYLAKLSAADPLAPHVPAVCHIFGEEGRMGYMVTKLTHTIEVPYEVLVAKAAEAVLWLRCQPAPPKALLGPVEEEGVIHHLMFPDREAPLKLRTSEALQLFVDRICRRTNPGLGHLDVFYQEVVFSQADADASNFGVRPDGRPVIFDYFEIGRVRVPLANFTLVCGTDFAQDIAKLVSDALHLGSKTAPDMFLIAVVKATLVMVYDKKLGLNHDGTPKRKKMRMMAKAMTRRRKLTQAQNVRIVRDPDSQLGKGIAYVQLKCVDELLALPSTKLTFRKRTLRLQWCKTLPRTAPSGSGPAPAAPPSEPSSSHSSTKSNKSKLPKGDPRLGSRIADLSKEERKEAKALDTDRVARRLAKKKLRAGLDKEKSHGRRSGGKEGILGKMPKSTKPKNPGLKKAKKIKRSRS